MPTGRHRLTGQIAASKIMQALPNIDTLLLNSATVCTCTVMAKKSLLEGEGCKVVCGVQAIPVALLHPMIGIFQDTFGSRSGTLSQSDCDIAVRSHAYA